MAAHKAAEEADALAKQRKGQVAELRRQLQATQQRVEAWEAQVGWQRTRHPCRRCIQNLDRLSRLRLSYGNPFFSTTHHFLKVPLRVLSPAYSRHGAAARHAAVLPLPAFTSPPWSLPPALKVGELTVARAEAQVTPLRLPPHENTRRWRHRQAVAQQEAPAAGPCMAWSLVPAPALTALVSPP